jgi:ketosteroid isomerase-like protein
MSEAVEAVRTATLEFYAALDTLLLGGGTQPMREAWHHDDCVSTVHPFDYWSRGWEDVWATWKQIATIFSYYRGHADRQDGIGTIHDLSVTVLSDVAYTTGIYKSCLYLPDGELRMSVYCTNILQRRNGTWKMVHHHPDQASPEWTERFGRVMQAAMP